MHLGSDIGTGENNSSKYTQFRMYTDEIHHMHLYFRQYHILATCEHSDHVMMSRG